jgi:hypothetical protein
VLLGVENNCFATVFADDAALDVAVAYSKELNL